MPYVNIKVTKEGGPDGTGPTSEEKQQLITGVTDLLQKVLNKNPATTFVVIDEVPLDNWGMQGRQVSQIRVAQT
ncbi:4-oxalocrotonate tautomerase family protein [uncultured Ruegeria sp.]|uniref:tautomerase family protein n=1 Tax=uncultured Ruegeria sp. TaxID=259304 RepID=UPI0026153CF0|nr:4-oxalocrotonate tautomerase family protein [uncultured Ruegeria sp.]